MSIDQTLGKLQGIINETLPLLELFVDQNVQPGSKDCENLQKQVVYLQEQLAIYKYQKTNKEISPSYDLHAKISEMSVNQTDVGKTEKLAMNEQNSLPLHTPKVEDTFKDASPSSNNPKKIEIALNQKFQFINLLFNQNATEYNTAIDQLNNCSNWPDAEIYIAGLKSIYQWKEQNENYKAFIDVAKKRFN